MNKSNDVLRTLAKFALGDQEVALVREAGNLLRADIPDIIDEFYDWLMKQDEFSIFFSDDVRSLERVKSLQTDYWTAFFHASLDDKYFASRRHIGAVHAHIELPNDVFCASMSTMHALIQARLRARVQPAKAQELDAAVSKLMFLDTYLVLDEISQIQGEKIIAHSKSLQELSTPVTPIWEGILLLPLLGIIDSSRTQDIMQKTLAKIAETRSKIFVMDISGVAAVDTAVANQLIKITKATQLMGCESIISGISPSISQTLVELGVNVGEVKTTATLRDALELGLRTLGDLRFLSAQPGNKTE
jgi:rsbT co-antagonist protein RsbR